MSSPIKWPLELDSRNKLATSRSKVSSCIGDAVAEEAETIGNASVAPILSSLERIGRIVQVRISPAVEDVEEIRTQRERHTFLDWDDFAHAQLLAGISRATVIAIERLGIGIGPGGRVCPRSGVEKERSAWVNVVVVETMQEERLIRNAICANRFVGTVMPGTT